jgi:hypothetical protein
MAPLLLLLLSTLTVARALQPHVTASARCGLRLQGREEEGKERGGEEEEEEGVCLQGRGGGEGRRKGRI